MKGAVIMRYISHYEEYPIYEPAEGGYYYPGNQLVASERWIQMYNLGSEDRVCWSKRWVWRSIINACFLRLER